MATKNVLAQDLSNMTSTEYLNVMRRSASLAYQDRIPEANAENLADIGKIVLNFQPIQNEFSTMVNRIAQTIVLSMYWENVFSRYKKGMLGPGETIEQVYVNIAKAHDYDPATAETEVFKREMPDISAAFHTINWKVFYKVTIENWELELAFTNENGVTDLIAKITDSLYAGAEIDDYLNMKQLIIDGVKNGRFYPVQISAPVAANSNSIVTSFKGISNLIEFPKTLYNPMGVPTATPKNKQILIVDAQFDAVMDVNTLASAFNMDKAQFMGQRILIDDFEDLTGVPAVLVDADWFMVYDKMNLFTNIFNAQGPYWNYFWHVWRLYSASPYANAIVFTTQESTVTGVTVTPNSTSVAKGASVQFTAEVTGTGYFPKGVYWEVTGAQKTSSWINSAGVLSVVKNEPNTTLTVTAKSIYNSEQTASATVTIS